jgi:hypothetical protein
VDGSRGTRPAAAIDSYCLLAAGRTRPQLCFHRNTAKIAVLTRKVQWDCTFAVKTLILTMSRALKISHVHTNVQ